MSRSSRKSSSDGQEREQDSKDNPNIDLAHQNSGWAIFL
jgi:hypothetical protein